MNRLYEKVLFYSLYASYILLFLVIIGVGGFAPQYLDYIHTFLKVYIGSILVIFYNPYYEISKKFEYHFMKKVAFHAGVFLLLTTALLSGLKQYFQDMANNVAKHIITN